MNNGRKSVLLLVLLIPCVAVFFYLNKVPFNGNSQYSDLINTHLPNALYINYSIRHYQQVPFWNTQILSGSPFAGDPLSGLWYPLTWLANLVPAVATFNFLFLLHILILGLGMYVFLKDEGLDLVPAVFGALSLELMPKIWAHYAAGHMTLIFSLAWIPWLLHFNHVRMQRRPTSFQPSIEILFYSLIIVADVRGAVYAGLFWFVMTFREAYRYEKRGRTVGQSLILTARAILGWLIQFICALLVCSVFLVPFLEFLQNSTRIFLAGGENLLYSLPPGRLLTLVLPNMGTYAEWVVYPGIWSVVAIILLGAGSRNQRKPYLFWFLFLLIVLLLSLGSYLPGLSYLFLLPGFNLLRVPPRLLFTGIFAFAVLSASAFQGILNGKIQFSAWAKRLLAVLGCFYLAFSIIFPLVTEAPEFDLVWATVTFLFILVLLFLWYKNRISKPLFIGLAFLILSVDLMGVNLASNSYRTLQDVVRLDRQVSEALLKEGGSFRVYSPSFSVSQTGAALFHLDLAGGVNPMLLADYANTFTVASGVTMKGYTVTLPPLASGDPNRDTASSDPNLEMLGKLNVKYVVSSFSMSATRLDLINRIQGLFIYQNPDFRTRAWVLQSVDSADSKYVPITNADVKANSIKLTAQGPGTVVVSDTFYPGWSVTVDGNQATLLRIDGSLRGVEIKGGTHTIQFRYQPRSLLWSALITVITLFSLSFNSFLSRHKYNFQEFKKSR
jgi:hypothetical protein